MLFISKKSTLITLLYLFVTGLFAQTNPNVVVIYADDFGFGDIAQYRRNYMPAGTTIYVDTPVMDKLMAEGMHFTDAHSPTALCAPSRYSVMTGNNPYHSTKPLGEFNSFGQNLITDSDLTLGELMKQASYSTAFIGKWHLGADFPTISDPSVFKRSRNTSDVNLNAILGSGPNFEGFDYSFNFPAGVQDFPYMIYENSNWFKIDSDTSTSFFGELAGPSTIANYGDTEAAAQGYSIDQNPGLGDSNWNPRYAGELMAQKAVDFITNTDVSTNPLFMYYCSQAVHVPHAPSTSLNGIDIDGEYATRHLGMIKELDVQIDMIIDALKAKGIYDDTVFIITSDNGGLGSNGSTSIGHDASGIYRGNKNQIFEGGHRVPFIVRWPNGGVAAGSTYDGIVSGTDIMATLAAITNQTLPESQGKDSFNLLPILTGTASPNEREFMMQQAGSTIENAIRIGDMKLIIDYPNSNFNQADIVLTALYDLSTDATESSNLLNDVAYADIKDYMLAQYIDVRYNAKPTKTINTANTMVLPGLVTAPASNEVIIANVPTEVVRGTSFQVEVDYNAATDGDIVVALYTPAGGFLRNTKVTVSAGTGTETLTLLTDAGWDVDNDYDLRVILRDVGGNSSTNRDLKNADIDLVDTLSLNDFDSNENTGFSIFPNPVKNGFFTLELNDSFKGAELKIYDLGGTAILETILGATSNEITVDELPIGVYIVKIEKGNTSSTSKLVIE